MFPREIMVVSWSIRSGKEMTYSHVFLSPALISSFDRSWEGQDVIFFSWCHLFVDVARHHPNSINLTRVAKCQLFYTKQNFQIKFYPKKRAYFATNLAPKPTIKDANDDIIILIKFIQNTIFSAKFYTRCPPYPKSLDSWERLREKLCLESE